MSRERRGQLEMLLLLLSLNSAVISILLPWAIAAAAGWTRQPTASRSSPPLHLFHPPSLPIAICPLPPSLRFSSTPHHQSIWTCCNFPQITIRTRLVWTQLPSIPLISPLFYPCVSINLEMQGIRLKWGKLGISIGLRVHFNKSQLSEQDHCRFH